MNNPQYLAQVGHTLGGCLAVIVTALFGGPHAVWVALPFLAVAAAAKEFWYDATYELPRQFFKDNLMDFVFYCVGAAIGVAIVCIRFYVYSAA